MHDVKELVKSVCVIAVFLLALSAFCLAIYLRPKCYGTIVLNSLNNGYHLVDAQVDSKKYVVVVADEDDKVKSYSVDGESYYKALKIMNKAK